MLPSFKYDSYAHLCILTKDCVQQHRIRMAPEGRRLQYYALARVMLAQPHPALVFGHDLAELKAQTA